MDNRKLPHRLSTYRKCMAHSKTPDAKIAILISYAKLKLCEVSDFQNARTRAAFNSKKPRRDQMCVACGLQSHCLHHIVQIQHGGDNRKKNLAALCNRCHEKIHPWMIDARIKYGLNKALEKAQHSSL